MHRQDRYTDRQTDRQTDRRVLPRSFSEHVPCRYPEAVFVQTKNLHKQNQKAAQKWIDVDEEGNEALLEALDKVLTENEGKRTIVFVNTVAMAQAAFDHLTQGVDPKAQVCIYMYASLYACVCLQNGVQK